jgi:hypothetical protein
MADTRTTTIVEKFGLIAVEDTAARCGYGRRPSCGRGYTKKLALAEASVGRKAR